MPTGSGINIVNNAGRTGLLWSSIGLAVFTSLLQGFVTTMVTIAEDQAMWTFRFRMARVEHWWWTAISVCLSTSFALIVLSFLSGISNDSVGVLALSTATAIAIVRFAIPAWRNRHFIENRWLAWTGSSRTGIPSRYANICGNDKKWKELDRKSQTRRAPPPSDDWGFAVRPPPGITTDPTAILAGFGELTSDLIYDPRWPIGPCIYDDGLHGASATNTISLLWGEQQAFRRRVSRAVNSMPIGLLKSRPITVDEYNGDGLCLAMGILGWSKGLRPQELVFDYNDALKNKRGLMRQHTAGSVTTSLEATSIWAPRPNKVMRSYYTHAMAEQFGTLPDPFIGAATELALILLDCSPRSIRDWLKFGLEQQSMEVNHKLSRPEAVSCDSPRATDEQLRTLYRAQYISTILSLNYYPSSGQGGDQPKAPRLVVRPDLICFTLLYLADGTVARDGAGRYKRGEGAAMPHWWTRHWVKDRLNAETASLKGNWQASAAWLAGLTEWPRLVESWPQWPQITYNPVYD